MVGPVVTMGTIQAVVQEALRTESKLKHGMMETFQAASCLQRYSVYITVHLRIHVTCFDRKDRKLSQPSSLFGSTFDRLP